MLLFSIKITLTILYIIVISNMCYGRHSSWKSFQKCIKSVGLPINSIIDQNSNATYYTYLNYQWNLRLPHINPRAYFLPKSTHDVQLVVLCGSKTNIPVIPKSGGHSFEGYSFGNSKTLIIDFRKMEQVIIDSKNKIVSIGPGALTGTVFVKLWEGGGYGVSIGVCLTTGIGGVTLGGGRGFFSNIYGLSLDNVFEITMVDGNGIAHDINANKNSDLFWGLRGVGSGYIGIVTNFKFKIFKISNFNISSIAVGWNLNQAPQFYESWENWLIWMDQYEPTQYVTAHIQDNEILTTALYLRDKDEYQGQMKRERFFRMFRQIFPDSQNINMSTLSYMELIKGETDILYGKPVPTTTDNDLLNLRNGMISSIYFKRKNFFVDKYFNRNELKPLVDITLQMPKQNIFIDLDYQGKGVRDIPASATAYVHRKSPWLITVEYTNPFKNNTGYLEGLNWMDEFIEKTKFMDNGETYQNYVDSDYEMREYLERYYGTNLQRLLNIKKKWDPKNYFRDTQSLPVVLDIIKMYMK